MRRIILLVAVTLVTVAMMLATAMPALAQHSPYDCRDPSRALSWRRTHAATAANILHVPELRSLPSGKH